MHYTISREDQRLQHAADRQSVRYAGLSGVFFTGPVCVASDGRILAVKLTESPDPPVDSIATFDRQKMKGRHDDQVFEKSESGSFVSPAGDRVDISLEGPGEGRRRFPDWKRIIPAENFTEARLICLDAELLYRLAKALIPKGEKLYVTVEFTPGNYFAPVRAKDFLDRAGMIALVTTVEQSDDFTACDVLRAVTDGRTLVSPTPVPVSVTPATASADVPNESELTLDFTDEELVNLAAALDVLNHSAF
jgi:hypothetical protein